jgi:hypothetical protein
MLNIDSVVELRSVLENSTSEKCSTTGILKTEFIHVRESRKLVNTGKRENFKEK